MKKQFYRLLVLTFILYLAMVILLYINQRELLYRPTPKIENNSPKIFLENISEKINVFILNGQKEKALFYFGGNAESMGRSIVKLKKNFPNYTLYLMDYRGFGESTGNPTQEGIYSDALVLYDKMRKKHKEIFVIGRSLGSAVATYVASKRDVSKLALVTPFDSILHVAQDIYWYIPLSLILKDQHQSIERVQYIRAKTLILTAQNDTLILPKYSDALSMAFESKKLKTQIILGRGHVNISHDNLYDQALKSFFE